MTRIQGFSLLLAVVLGVVGLALVTSTARADTPPPVEAEFSVYDPGAVPDLSAFDEASVIDEAEYHTVSEITQRITPYIYVDGDGIPQLEDVTAEELGVDETFLENFKLAMEFSNAAIADGQFKINPDLTVEVAGVNSSTGPVVELVPTGPVPPMNELSLAGGTTPDWQTWNYPNRGAMIYNSYPDYYNHYYNRYYVLCNSMAASLGYPWMSNNLMNYYSYNNWHFSRYCYQNYGTYYYLPYSGGCCRQYNPCYCGGMTYRVVYIWVRTYSYTPSCGCYQYNWNWQGHWGRY